MIADELLRDLLAAWPVGRLATLDEPHAPHLVPIVFCLDGEALYSPVDGKRKRGRPLKRLQNVAANDSCSLLLDQYDDDWRQLWWVRLDGTGEVYRPAADHEAVLRRRLLAKYPQYASVPITGDDPVFLRMRWTKVSAWAETDLETSVIRALAKPSS